MMSNKLDTASADPHGEPVPQLPHSHPQRLVFSGERRDGHATVLMADDGKPSRFLPLHLSVRNHSPTGFEWGYQGSGPAQLALALCIEVVGQGRAVRSYQAVKDALVAPLSDHVWMIGGSTILAAVEAAEQLSQPK